MKNIRNRKKRTASGYVPAGPILRRIAFGALALASAACLLSGCKKGVALMADGKVEKGYSLSQIMVIAMTEKNRYEEICTDQIWDVKVQEGEETFSTLLTEQLQSFMEEMKIMNLLAQEKQISLTSEERADMEQAAEEYYRALTAADIEYMGVTKEDVQTVFEDYRLASKLVDELTGDVSLEVSDSEAKVITVQQAVTEDRAAAEALAASASAEGADFQKSASDAGLSVTTRQLGRAEESKGFEDAAFALTTGQVSGVIESEGSYYVLKCVSDYDEAATTERKARIFQERKWKAFTEIYDGFKAGINLTYSGEPWKKLDLTKNDVAEGADFFAIYKKFTQQ